MAVNLIPYSYPEDASPIFDAPARALAHVESLRLALAGLEPEASAAALHGVIHHLVDELRTVERALLVVFPNAGDSDD